MSGGKGNIKPEDGKQFSKEYQPTAKWTEKKALELGKELIDWLNAKDEEGNDIANIFFEEFIVIEKDYYPQLTTYLMDKFSSFSNLIGKAKKIQELKLVKYGVADRLNSTMTKFVLTNHHEYSDKSQHDHTTKGKEIFNNEIDLSKLDTSTLEALKQAKESED